MEFQNATTAIIPPFSLHGFRPLVAARLQFIFTGADNREDFFNGLAEIVNGKVQLNTAEPEAFNNRHDQYFK